MRSMSLTAAALCAVVTVASAQNGLRSFDQDAVGATPPGFSLAAARLSSPGRWLIRAEGANRFLAHTAEPGANEGFAIALLDDPVPAEVRLSARLRLEEGERAGGLVWRYQGPDSFYAVSLDLDAQEIALYRVSRGNRIRLELEDDLELDRSAWHTLRVDHVQGRIRVALGGIGVLRARARDADSGEGRAGVWSAGNAATAFDDVSVQPAGRDRQR